MSKTIVKTMNMAMRRFYCVGFAFSLLLGLAVHASPVAAQSKPLKVFVLVGQSNMQGHADIRTLPHLGMHSDTQPMLEMLRGQNEQFQTFPNIKVSYLSNGGIKTGDMSVGFGANENKIGPELTFGIFMQQRVDQPILIIKTAWGGKSLHTDFRPPSAGPFEFEPAALKRFEKQGKDIAAIKAEKQQATGVYYRHTIDHVKEVLADIKSVYPEYDAQQGFELSGLVWFQGWNDMVDSGVYPKRNKAGGYDKYSEVLRCLIRDFRKDLSSPDLPIVIGVMGVGGPTDQYDASKQRNKATHQNFRDAMAAPASDDEFQGNVVTVLTEQSWDMELDALVARDTQLKNALKKQQENGEFPKKEWRARLEATRKAKFSERDFQLLELGVSNAAYHYLGSSRIMTSIGKQFAEAMPLDDGEIESKSKKSGSDR